MGWGIEFTAYASRIHSTEIDSKIEELEQDVLSCKEKLIALAAASPREVRDNEGNVIYWEDYIQSEVNDLLEWYESSCYTLSLLYQAKMSEVKDV